MPLKHILVASRFFFICLIIGANAIFFLSRQDDYANGRNEDQQKTEARGAIWRQFARGKAP